MLDEPTNDVDPVRRRLLWRQVRTLADHGAAVLLVTHNVIEAERSVDRLAILDEGRVIAEGTPAELKARSAPRCGWSWSWIRTRRERAGLAVRPALPCRSAIG